MKALACRRDAAHPLGWRPARLLLTAALSLALCSSARAQGSADYARANRLAISFGAGIGSASLSSYHGAVDLVRNAIASRNAGLTLEGDGKSSFQVSAEFSFRYYFPYYILAQIGFGAIYNTTSITGTASGFEQAIESHNLVMEVPILVGGYYPLISRLYLYGALGPSVLFFSRAYWDPGTDFEADGGVGFHILGGADFLLADHFGLGLELRYRHLKTGQLKIKGTNLPVTPPTLGGQGSQTYDLDFSGVTLLLNLRVFAI